MIKKLKWKFVAVNMLLVSTVLVAVFGILVYSNYRKAENDSIEALKSILMRGADSEFLPPKFEIGDKAPRKHTKMLPIFCVSLDADWNVIKVVTENAEISDEVLGQAVEGVKKTGGTGGKLSDLHLRYLREETASGIRIAFADTGSEIESMKNLLFTSLFVGFIALGAFFVISLFLARRALLPVKKAWARQKQFVADASHELKTPITVILANAGILLSHKEDTIGAQKKWVEYISAEAGRMKELVEDMLFLAKSDAEETAVLKTKVNFSDLVWSCLLPFESVAFEQGVRLNSEVEPDLCLSGNEGQLKQLVAILLDNAIKYAGKKGSAAVSLEREQDRLRLSVNNSGEAIPQEHLDHLFERFYRADQARSRDKGGYGLGLAIAKQIVENHKGRIGVESRADMGTTFLIYFNLIK